MKNRTEVLVGELMANKVLEQPLTCLTVDFITKLLLVAVKDMILVVYDRLSRITHFVATIEGMSVEVAWIAKEYDIRQKTLVCSKIDERAE